MRGGQVAPQRTRKAENMIATQAPKDMYTMTELRKANAAERALRENADTFAWEDRNYSPEEDRGDYDR